MITTTQPAPLSLEVLRDYEARGLLMSARHPSADLTIWNYTRRCQYAGEWDEVTMQCRGLVTNDAGQIVARPFRKFFGLDEHEQVFGEKVPDEPFEVFEKLDGSLILMFDYRGARIIASRGRFTGPQVELAWELFLSRYAPLAPWPGHTYLFELIHPQNRIVVDYGDRADLVLLSIIETATGREVPPDLPRFPVVRRVEHAGGFRDLPRHPNEEGYVIHFQSGVRVKVKNDEYVRLHRLLTCTSPKTIWEAMRDGVPLEELLTRVPDEFDRWVRGVMESILADYQRIEQEAAVAFAAIDVHASRREIALSIRDHPLRSVLFTMLDGKDTSALIWKMVKPETAETDAEDKN